MALYLCLKGPLYLLCLLTPPLMSTPYAASICGVYGTGCQTLCSLCCEPGCKDSHPQLVLSGHGILYQSHCAILQDECSTEHTSRVSHDAPSIYNKTCRTQSAASSLPIPCTPACCMRRKTSGLQRVRKGKSSFWFARDFDISSSPLLAL